MILLTAVPAKKHCKKVVFTPGKSFGYDNRLHAWGDLRFLTCLTSNFGYATMVKILKYTQFTCPASDRPLNFVEGDRPDAQKTTHPASCRGVDERRLERLRFAGFYARSFCQSDRHQ
jgi:hypothetical protein